MKYNKTSINGIMKFDIDIPTAVNGTVEPWYRAAYDMTLRCMPKFWAKCPTYQGCSVGGEFLNVSGFKKWFDANYVKGWQLDKDILFPGNKMYHELFCIYAQQWLNNLLTDCGASRGLYPIGVSRHGAGFQAQLSRGRINGKRVSDNLGKYATVEEAAQVYRWHKTLHIRSKYPLIQDPRIIKGLESYIELNLSIAA